VRDFKKIGLFLFLISFCSINFAAEINVAVASNFGMPMKQIVAEFEKRTGNIVNLSLGSSGRFVAQIVNGAPFSAFFSADQSNPQALENAGLLSTIQGLHMLLGGWFFGHQRFISSMVTKRN
jgi:ABC-type molybdate transport system substrate-binding protein